MLLAYVSLIIKTKIDMEPKIFFENKVAKVLHNEEKNYGKAVWSGFAHGESYQNVLNSALRLFKEKNISLWMADLRDMEAITEEDQKWANEVWFPQAIGGGLKKIAILISKDAFNQMAVEEIMTKVDAINFSSGYFSDFSEAEKWLTA